MSSRNSTDLSSPSHIDPSEHEPQRLSALYQYHNAPEVAPAHGLEYDDTVYPSSDKYPVIREAPSYDPSYKGKHAFINDNRPPRIIFGMKVKTFLIVSLIMIMVIVGAAVGGAVGGQQMRNAQVLPNPVYTPSNSTSTSAPTATSITSTSTFSAPTPTYTPLSDCPASNDTSYTSTYAKGSSGDVPAGAGLLFTKYCDLENPLTQSGATRISQAFVYSFSDCVELCAGYNFIHCGENCTVAVYQPAGSRPSNCWVGSTQNNITATGLGSASGTDVALLLRS